MHEDRGNTTEDAPPATRHGLLHPAHLAALLGARAAGGDVQLGALSTGAGARRSPAALAGLPEGLGVAFDSRRVRPGDVFFALPGASSHGIAHARDALARGAAYVVSDVEPPLGLLVPDALAALMRLGAAARERLTGPVIGVTGSAGKTTTKTLVTAALAGRSTPGNLNTVPALVAALVEAALMDAGAPVVNRGALVGDGGPGSAVVLELGIDRPGEMAELLAFCRPDHGLVTAIGESHLAALGDVASVAREKSLLLARAPGVRLATASAAAHLPPEVAARTTVVVVTEGESEQVGPQEPFTDATGASAPAPQQAGIGSAAPHGGAAVGHLSAGRLAYQGSEFALPWPGRALAENVLLTLALAQRLGVELGAAFTRLADSRLEPGRLQRRSLGEVELIDDSYNSNPLSAALALEVLRAAPPPRVAILGDMRELGNVSRQRHRELGAATRGLDLVIAVGPEAAALAEGNPAVIAVADVAAAGEKLGLIPRGATVLVKGSRSLALERLVALLEARHASDRAVGP